MSNELSLNINRIINDIKSKNNDFKNNLNETNVNNNNNPIDSTTNSITENDMNSKKNDKELNDENRSIDSIITPKKKNLRLIPVKTLYNESNFVNFFKVILVSLCFAFFAYNVYFMTKRYLDFDTMISLAYKAPDKSELPGLTVCGPFIITPNILKTISLTNYTDGYNSSDAETNLKDSNKMKDKKSQFDKNQSIVLENMDVMDILKNYSMKFEDLVMKCVYINYTIEDDNQDSIDLRPSGVAQNCTEISDVVESIYEGRKCFTLFSRLNNFYIRRLEMKYDYNPKIEITISTKDYLWSYGDKENAILMAVHPKTIIPTHLDFDYFIILKQEYYLIYFRKQNSTLLEPPWKTACHDYLKDCSCKMRQQCLGRCIKRLTFAEQKCINWNGVITDKIIETGERFCRISEQNYTLYINARRICEDECPPECHQIIYETYGNAVNLERNLTCINKDDCNATVSIMIHNSPFIMVQHMPEYTSDEIMGAVGGHLGIWLSLSVITIIDLLLTLMEKSFLIIKAKYYKKE